MSPSAGLTVTVLLNWLVLETSVKTHVFKTILVVETKNVLSWIKLTERKVLHVSVPRDLLLIPTTFAHQVGGHIIK